MKPILSVLLLLLVLVVVPTATQAQGSRTRNVNLPFTTSGFIGGSNQNKYVVHLNKGQKLHVEVFNSTLRSRVYFDVVLAGTEKRFGRDVNDSRWEGRAPKTGDYEVRVVAHPFAHYRLKIW